MYRIVIADSRAPRDGAFIESIGYYHPLSNPSTIVVDAERARHWLAKGAQPSDRVWKLFAIQGVAEMPEELKRRIELRRQRAQEAKAQAAAAPSEASAEEPTTEGTGEAAASEAARAEASAEESEAPAESEES
jgi:small subunit ribosomal protein S16